MPVTVNVDRFQSGNATGKAKLNKMVDAIEELQQDMTNVEQQLNANKPNWVQCIVFINGAGLKSINFASDGNAPRDITPGG